MQRKVLGTSTKDLAQKYDHFKNRNGLFRLLFVYKSVHVHTQVKYFCPKVNYIADIPLRRRSFFRLISFPAIDGFIFIPRLIEIPVILGYSLRAAIFRRHLVLSSSG